MFAVEWEQTPNQQCWLQKVIANVNAIISSIFTQYHAFGNMSNYYYYFFIIN